MTTINTPALDKFTALTLRKRKLKAELSEIETELRTVGARLLDDMLTNGVKSIKVADATVYVQESMSAKLREDIERKQAIDGLERLGLGDLLKVDFNLNTLSAWCREVRDSGEELPPGFSMYFDVETRPELRVRKSS